MTRTLLVAAALIVASQSAAPSQGLAQNRFRNTPFDPGTWNPVRWFPTRPAQHSMSQLAVDTPTGRYHVNDDGYILQQMQTPGGRGYWDGTGRRANLDYDSNGLAYWTYFENGNEGFAKYVRAPSRYDRRTPTRSTYQRRDPPRSRKNRTQYVTPQPNLRFPSFP